MPYFTTFGHLIHFWLSVISTIGIIKESIPCIMIWNVDYFHRSAVSVACIYLNELDILSWKFLLFQVDNVTLRLTKMMGRLRQRRNIARAGTNSHGHSHLIKAKSCYKITRHHKRSKLPLAGGSPIGKTQTSKATPTWSKPIATLTWLELLILCSGPSHL